MFYKLTVIKREETPEYEAKMKEYEEKQRDKYGYSNMERNLPAPGKYESVGVLEMVLTEEQFKAVKKAALEQFI